MKFIDRRLTYAAKRSLSLRRAWIEIPGTRCHAIKATRRSPYGERGLKSHVVYHPFGEWKSLSLRRAWIEISTRPTGPPSTTRRSPYGERGLKWRGHLHRHSSPGRSPYGERGLKSKHRLAVIVHAESLSLRRAWIEINGMKCWKPPILSLSLRRAWIEIRQRTTTRLSRPSFSLRRAWIEIDRSGCAAALWCVSASWHPQYRHYFSAA